MSHSKVLLNDAPMTILLPTSAITTEPILPELIIWIYIAVIVVLGFLLNFILIGTLLKSKCNGKTLIGLSFLFDHTNNFPHYV